MEHLEQLRWSGLFETRVPRYTSYPPANRFAPAEGNLYQQRWLSAVPDGSAVSIYIHVPYCKNLCWFCACRTQAETKTHAINAYVDTLIREITMVRAALPKTVQLSRLYMGGGTPTIISPEYMRKLVRHVYDSFSTSDDFEFSVEVDTAQVTDGLIERLIEFGMNRALVGVQDFDPEVQHVIGREQSFEQTLNVVRKLRRAGLPKLDMEMLHGLPAQTSNSIAETAQQVLALEPDRLSICEYAHVPTVSKRQLLIDARKVPASEDSFLLSQVARHILINDGYEPIGIDRFVRRHDKMVQVRDNKQLKRDFEGYSDHSSVAMIGLGASAISKFPQGYVQNVAATSRYVAKIYEGRLSGNRGYRMSGNDHLLASMIEMLMCYFEVDAQAVTAEHPGTEETVQKALKSLSKAYEPFVVLDGNNLVIKPFAHPMARMICETLDRAGRLD